MTPLEAVAQNKEFHRASLKLIEKIFKEEK